MDIILKEDFHRNASWIVKIPQKGIITMQQVVNTAIKQCTTATKA